MLRLACLISGGGSTAEATAQRVSAEFDDGAVLRRLAVPILPGDSVEDLAHRMLPHEHTVQIDTLLDFANGTVAEQTREPLIRRDEDVKLWQAKQVARMLYPHG